MLENRDPPLWTLIILCVFTIGIIYVLQIYLLDGNESVWGWYLVGIGGDFMIIALFREIHIKNRVSSFIMIIFGTCILLIGMGFIYGLRNLLNIYIYTIIFILILLLFFKKKLKKDI